MANQELAREHFQRQLRELIRREYRSQRAFAEHVGLSPGRVAQLVGPAAESLSYPSLERLLDAFPHVEDQLSLYAAWKAAFAPAPELVVPTAHATEEELTSALLECRRLLESGHVGLVGQASRRLWRDLQSRSQTVCLALSAAGLLVECLLIQDRFPAGLAVARKMEELATRADESALAARALWHQALATRLLAGDQPSLAEPAFQRLRQCLEAHSPGRVGGDGEWRELHRSLARDEALLIWHENRWDQTPSERLAAAIEGIERELGGEDDPMALALGREIVARSQILLGRFDEASRSLDDAQKFCPAERNLLALKVQLAKVSLQMATGEMQEAWNLTERAMATAERHGLQHYRIKLGGFQRTIVVADLGKRFVST